MNALYLLQKQMVEALTKASNAEFFGLSSPAPLSGLQGIAIYRDSFTTALMNVLGDTYEVCRTLVGDAFFHAMAKIYVQQTPSHSANISDYGSNFADFVTSFPPAQSLLYLGDVAKLEWAWHDALHGVDGSLFDPSSLSHVDEKQYATLIFQLPLNSHLISSDYPIHRIWAMHQADFSQAPQINVDDGGVRLLVWRRELDTHMDVLTSQEWDLLAYINAGLNLTQICENLGDSIDLAQLLPECFRRGWIAGFQE